MRQVQELEERPFKSGAAQTLADRVFSNNIGHLLIELVEVILVHAQYLPG
jgi:hypothetical protein